MIKVGDKVKILDKESSLYGLIANVVSLSRDTAKVEKYGTLCPVKLIHCRKAYSKKQHPIPPRKIPIKDKLGVERVIYNGNTTIVFLENGTKGVSTCSAGDTFDPVVGYAVAYLTALSFPEGESGKMQGNKSKLKSFILSGWKKQNK